MKSRSGEKIKLTSIDELLGVVNEESAMEIEINRIHAFKDHPFKVLDDEKMADLVESVKTYGVLTPVLLRSDGENGYEMISGHRRMHAAVIAGLATIPAIVRELSDDDAVIAMVDANIQREELLPSEKAFAYRMKLEAMKRQGVRNDLTLCQNGTKYRTDVVIAEQVGESARNVQEECEEEKKEKSKMVKFTNQTSVEKEGTEEVYNSNFKKSQNQTSRSPENKLQEVYNSNSNNTNINNTNQNNNKSNHIVSADVMGSEDDEMETLRAYQSLIKENLDYESLLVSHPHDKDQIDEIVDLIVETVICKSEKVLIASNWYSGALVRGKFMKLDYSHVEYVLHCLEGNTSKIKNIKKYLLAALFNAPSTISGYYRAEVNHDMPWLAR